MASRTFAVVFIALMLGVLSTPGVAAQSCAAKALEFDGVDDCVTIPFDPSLPAETFTLAAWIRSPGLTGDDRHVINYGEDIRTDNHRWNLHITSEGTLRATIETCSDADGFYDSGVFVADGVWHHVAATRDLSGSLRLFVDGSPAGNFTNTLTPCPTAIQNPQIGCFLANPDGLIRFFSGTIDEVSVWNRPLSDARIAEIVEKGIVNTGEQGLVAYWRMDEESGQAVFDQSPFGNHAFLGEQFAPDFRDPLRVDSDAPFCTMVTYDVWTSSSADTPPHEPIHDCLHITPTTITSDVCGDSGPTGAFPIPGIPGVNLWTGQVPCQGQDLFFVGTTLDTNPLPLGGRAIGASIVATNTGLTLGTEGFENADCTATGEANGYGSVAAASRPAELTGVLNEGSPPALEIGPPGTAQTVANKTYEFWFSRAFDPPPFEPTHDCVHFTDTTMTTDACGDTGPLVEFPLFGVPGMSFWIGQVPCGGQNFVFFGTSFDGGGFPSGGNVMSGTAVGITQGTTLAIEGFENSACSILP